ncbi:MAG TPA: ABC transporter substrate-binding protein [Candidatus Dormibacteraeota bacterium]|nr:ABC transporter substrate-binding protein [Candidatus Dormibacteraeota bacterium]
MSDRTISRETFLKGAGIGAAALSAGIPAFIPSRGEAAEALKIGLIEEITGIYAAFARSEIRGANLAVAAWNTRGGVMGRPVQMLVEDNQNNPGVGVEKARKLVNQDKVAALAGTINSSAALAISAAAATMNVPFVDSGSHADQISGVDCHWNTFQTCHATWMQTHATGYSIAKKFGKKWYLITPDYAFGHAIAAGYQDVLKSVGGEIVGNDLTPLGTTDFSPYLTKIEAAKPDCIIAIVNGSDLVNMLKQASSFGLLKKFPVAGPQIDLETAWALPEDARVGFWGVEWYYQGDLVHGKSNAVANAFVSAYTKEHHEPPTAHSAFAYVAVDRLLWAINEAKTTDAVKVSKTLAGAPFHSLWDGASEYRTVDHQLMWPMWFGELRKVGPGGSKVDLLEIVDRQPADKIAQSAAVQAKICKLDYPS